MSSRRGSGSGKPDRSGRPGAKSGAAPRRGSGGKGSSASRNASGKARNASDKEGAAGGKGRKDRRPGRSASSKSGSRNQQSGSRSQQSGQRRPPSKSKGLGGDQVEGRQAVRELLLSGKRPVREVLMIDEMDSADILDDITELAQEAKVAFRVMTRRKFESEALTLSHQGVLARAKPLQAVGLDSLVARKNAFLLVLDGVTDPQNLGAILRTAECAGVNGIVLPRHRAAHITPTVTKTAAGAVEHLPMALVGGIPTAVTELSAAGVLTVGLDMAGETDIFSLPLDAEQKVALVLGAEGAGLGRLVRERVDVVSAIPLRGDLNSLNVAMAGAIACFEVVRRRATRV